MILIKFIPILFIINSVTSGIVLHKDIGSVTREVRDTYKYNHPPSAEYFAVPVSVVYEEGNRKEKSLVSNVSTTQNSDVEADSTERLSESDTASTTISDSKEINSEFNTDAPRSKDVSVAQGKEISEESVEKATENTPLNKKHLEDELNSSTTETTLLLENHAKSGPNKSDEKITLSPVEDIDDDDVKILYNEKNDFTSQENYEHSKIRVDMPHDGLIIPVAVVYDVEPEYLRKRNNNRVTVKTDMTPRQQRDKNTEKLSDIEKDVCKPAVKDKNSRENIKSASFPKRSEGRDPIVPIIQSENYVFSHSGDFHYSYEGADGTKAFERGALSDTAGEAVEGSFSYVGKDGKDYSLTYTADENGYRPSGAHLPTPPPIPPAIARALKYLATKATTETVTERLH